MYKKKPIETLILFFFISFSLQSQVLLRDINDYWEHSHPIGFEVCGDFLYFRAIDNPFFTYNLYRTDGTPQGTVLLKSDPPYVPSNYTCMDTFIYFTNYNNNSGGISELWRTDGTTNGTVMLDPIGWNGTSAKSFLSNYNGELYFTQEDDFVKLEFSSNGPEIITLGSATEPLGAISTMRFPVYLDQIFFYDRRTSTPLRGGLSKSDGTIQGTGTVKTLMTRGYSYMREFVESGSYAYFDTRFLSSTVDRGWELWRTDGTGSGTQLVQDINAGAADSNPADLTDVNGTLFFTADDGTIGRELWRTRGALSNTLLIKDINSAGGSEPEDLVAFNGVVYFSALSNATVGRELWRSDGTSSGTVMVKDINPTGSSNPEDLTVAGDLIYFSADDGVNGRELWQTDGTAAGTQMVSDLNPVASSSPRFLTYFNDILFFTADDGFYGRELWILESNPLAVELLAFNGSLVEDKTILEWTSISEINHDVYILEHSIDGKNFNIIGEVDGLGTEEDGHEYQFVHHTPVFGDNYYRLQMVDIENNIDYSKVVVVSNGANDMNFSVYPTIASNDVQISFTGNAIAASSNATIEIRDIYGRLVERFTSPDTQSQINTNISRLSTGHYFVLLRKDHQIIANQRFIKN